MTKLESLSFLINLFPHFQAHWYAKDNYYREGDNFSEHGLWAAFSNFFRENIDGFSDQSLKELFSEIEAVVSVDPNDINPMANAMCTCFLENISSTKAGSRSLNYMGKASKEFFNYWHTEADYE